MAADRRKRRKQRQGRRLSALIGAAAVLVLAASLWAEGMPAERILDWAKGTSDAGKQESGEKGGSGSVNGELIVTFLDVGQGNAVLAECGGEYMLIDGGDRDYSSFVVSYLQRQGVGELSYIVCSHYDADHINGLIGALYVFSVDTVLDGDYEWDTKTYASFQSAVEENGCQEIHPSAGEIYALGDAEFTVICPDNYSHSDSNDNSIGIRLAYGENAFLICGDAGSDMEAWMLEQAENVGADVLLCSHHGSRYSTSEAFLEAVGPSAVVISCGADNAYGHPSKRVMELLAQGNYDLYRTDVQGTLIAVSDGSSITWNAEPTADYSWRTAE